MGGDLWGLGDGVPKFEVGTAHSSVPSNILRSTVIGCESKYKLIKKASKRISCSEIEDFGLEKGHILILFFKSYIYIRFQVSDSRDRQKTDKIKSMTEKGHQKFWA